MKSRSCKYTNTIQYKYKYKIMEHGIRFFDAKVRKLRSRSCERVLRKCRGLGRAVHGKVQIQIQIQTINIFKNISR